MNFVKVSTPNEIKVVSELAYLLFPLDYGAYIRKSHIIYFLDKYQSESAIAKQIERGFEYYIIQNNEEVMGYIGFEIKHESLKLSKLYLNLNARGKGVGAEAMHWLKEYAIQKKCANIELLVLEENKNAIRFYERLGYKKVGVFEEHFKTGYSEVNNRMIQKL